jgi:hypothetical protein
MSSIIITDTVVTPNATTFKNHSKETIFIDYIEAAV